MDATLKGLPLSKKDVANIFDEILNIDINDGVLFHLISIKDIRLENVYGGFRLNILSRLDNNKTYITVELTTGDIITPREIKYNYNSFFENKKITIMAYTLETILAEIFQTIITRGLLNTRLKDFYYIYILIGIKIDEINKTTLKKAVQNTFERRETPFDLNNFDEIVNELKKDERMNQLWKEYQQKNFYANNIEFKSTINTIQTIIKMLAN